MIKFIPQKTEDGSIGLYNKEVDDIYHSSRGAYSEAIEKFITPSGILTTKKKQIKILDICYGLGYNAKSAIESVLSQDANIKLQIDCVELDPYVVAFSLLIKEREILKNYRYILAEEFLKNKKIQKCLIHILENNLFADYYAQDTLNLIKEYKLLKNTPSLKHLSQELNSNLHNIYYKNISSRNTNKKNNLNKSPKIHCSLSLMDARDYVKSNNKTYDYIFLDAFTPAKLPTLWTVEFFKELKRLLNNDGNITTYSNSAAIRAGMLEAGLFVGKAGGTIAYKNHELINSHLSKKELGLINTKAGIPFRDQELTLNSDEIIKNREIEVSESNRLSSSRYLKDFQKIKKPL